MAPSPVHIRLAGSYDFERFERMVRDLRPLLSLESPSVLELDMSGMVFIGPTSLALLEATIRRLEERELLLSGGWLAEPKNRLTNNYLHRMDFFSGLKSLQQVDEPFTRRPAVGFRPCQQFEGADDYWSITAELTKALVERCDVQSPADAAIRICLDELAENVIHHADSDAGGFAAAQGTPRRRRFEVGIVDLGIGIRRSLAKNPEYASITDDVEAIKTALQPFVTSTPARNLGTGLFITKLLLRQNGGDLLIRSGNGLVRGGTQEMAEHSDLELPGTVVALRARTDRTLDLNPVYEELDEHDDGDGVDQAS